MNLKLFLSNLRTSVRNLLKYKVQNVISILCLAVGIVCFTVTLHFVSALWKLNYEDSNDSECTRVDFRESKESVVTKPLDPEAFQKLIDQKPASIQHLLFKEENLIEAAWTLTDLDGKEWELQGGLTAISPEYLHHYGFYSAITGKPIERLKPGTIIMSDGLWKKTLGGKTNPVGWHASVRADRVLTGPVSDVVRSSMRGQLEGMFIVSDTPFQSQFFAEVFSLNVVLAKGKTRADLDADLQQIYTDRFPFVWAVDTSGMVKITVLCGLFLFLGSIVLIIGLLGFLKMQLQLFHLRSREMALRRCVGARPWQLFWLLAIEVVIVFIITTLVALGITTLVADYALPILYKVVNDTLYIDMEIIYGRELWISLLATLLTLVIAALAVRRTLHAPLGMTVGRSQRINHTGRSVMLVIQYVFCIFLLAVILGTYYYTKQAARAFHVPEDPSYIKQCMLIKRASNMDVVVSGATQSNRLQYFTNSELASLPSMEQAGGLLVSEHLSFTEIDTMLYVNMATLMNDDNMPMGYMYAVASANEQYFLAMGLHPVSEYEGMDRETMVPVFVRPEDADRMARSLQAEEGTRRHRRVLADGQEYVSIGYVPVWHDVFGYTLPSYFMIVPEVDENILRETLAQWNGTEAYYHILRPKPHRYAQLTDELNELYHEKCPKNLMPLEIANVYDTWFTLVRWAEMLQQLCWLLTVISLLCIVVSVYSAVSLDTRGREKEVAIRKVHGAKVWDIIRLFGRYYLRLLTVSAVIAVPLGIALGTMIMNIMRVEANVISLACEWIVSSLLIVTLITILTIGEKIYRVSRTNPADVIKKE